MKQLFILVVLVLTLASFAIKFSVQSSNLVYSDADTLSSEYLPAFDALSDLQQFVTERELDLHRYYASTDRPPGLDPKVLEEQFEKFLASMRVTEENREDFTAAAVAFRRFIKRANAFDEEMSGTQDWDELRFILADAGASAMVCDRILDTWNNRLRSDASRGAGSIMRQISDLQYAQLVFSIAVVSVALLSILAIYGRMKDQEKLFRQARFDALTGLKNRASLEQEWELLDAAASELPGAVFLIGLDRFNLITGTFGHHTGDMLIQSVSNWLSQRTPAAASLYRFASSSWVLMIPHEEKENDCECLAGDLLELAGQALTIDERTFNVSLSIGISYIRYDGEQLSDLLREADAAQREVAMIGGQGFRFFEDSIKKSTEEFLTLETWLRAAVETNELELHYQPKVDSDGKIAGAEALLRWEHEGQKISPGQFVPVAEKTALVCTLGRWVLTTACRSWIAWQKKGVPMVPVAINISAQHFAEPDFVEQVIANLQETGMPADQLELEVTEEAAAENPERVIETLERLKEIGVRIAIDDFGTGYSSLSYLKRFPLDVLKIDQAFVSQMLDSGGNEAIVHMILTLAHELELDVVAEGVETDAQCQVLRALECEYMQGYFFSRPMTATQLEAALISGETLPLNEGESA